jgi:hypothetical protein
MPHTLRICAIAYTNGHKEGLKWNGELKNCPYGFTKRELQAWWCAGFHDTKAENVDYNMIITKGKSND